MDKKYNDILLIVNYNKLLVDFNNEYTKVIKHIEGDLNINWQNMVIRPQKTPSQNAWKTWSKENTEIFRNNKKAMNYLLQFGYIYSIEKEW